ncbi:DUF3953 domain-containing protein [Lacticigenium naphthae]|uniref:DUF3953 domain-containing protein n=1 Tax=Lacticigenium naphthae TaxID=515351 RepID=UPI00047FBE0A|nr:DUF3953 domain-containing protein [Lacticigenium naphthae]
MLKILRIVLSIIGIVIAGYALLSKNYIVMPYMLFFMGATLLVLGIAEIIEERKQIGIISIFASLFIFYVSVHTLLFA